jgi:hypothetical protein
MGVEKRIEAVGTSSGGKTLSYEEAMFVAV